MIKKGWILVEHKIFKNKNLPFVELRYAQVVRGCSKSHTHELITIIAIKERKVNLILNKKEEIINNKTIAFLNPNTAHCIEVLDKKSLGDYVLHLDKSWCAKLQKELFSNDDYLPLQKVLLNTKNINKNFLVLCNKLLSTDSSLEKERDLVVFMKTLFLDFLSVSKPEKNNTTSKAQKIKDYLDENTEDNLSLKELSLEFLISEVHIIRLFKKEFDLSIHSYLLNKKVHKARELLGSKETILNIALQSGFYDQSHLNKAFKRVFSLTPKEYQDNILKC